MSVRDPAAPVAVIRASNGDEVGDVDRRMFGGFVEHLGRSVYTGIYEPGHPTADGDGFRGDVVSLVRELGMTTFRYPGGNFVSGYRWEDGVGPREDRPRRPNLAWHSLETNEIGLHEFARWVEVVGGELMLAINLGTRGVEAALDLLEYSNIRSGTHLSDLRAANGRAEPFGVLMWCLGNEMDGPWQLGYRTGTDYGKLASQTAKALRQLDDRLELVVCGSSDPASPTFGDWETAVLDESFDDVDLLSLHAYYEEHGDRASYLASGVHMDRFIEDVVAIADAVQARRRSPKRMQLSFDEWNVWDRTRYHASGTISGIDNWPEAPSLLEDVYTVTDAVVVGGMLISLLKHADRIRAASMAQVVNVIAPIMTEPGGSAWRQTTFWPFAHAARLVGGTVLRTRVDVETSETPRHGAVPLVDSVVVRHANGRSATVLLVNRDQTRSIETRIDMEALGMVRIGECVILSDADPSASNSAADPDRVRPVTVTGHRVQQGVATVDLPPVSWTVVTLEA